MTVPRVNVLANTTRNTYALLSLPYDTTPLYTTPDSVVKSTSLLNSSLLYDYSTTIPSGALQFSINITGIPLANATGTANFTFLSSVTGESIRGGLFLAGGNGDTPLWMDRGNTRGFDNPFFTDKFSTDVWLNEETQTVRLLGVLDRSILEVFLNNGEKAGTMIFFPQGELDTLIIGTSELNVGVTVSAEVYGLQSTWTSQEVGNGNGTVLGNLTMSSMAAGQKMRRNNLGHLR